MVRPDGTDEDLGVPLDPYDAEVWPGTQGDADLWFLFRSNRFPFSVGERFALREGDTQIGEGHVLNVAPES